MGKSCMLISDVTRHRLAPARMRASSCPPASLVCSSASRRPRSACAALAICLREAHAHRILIRPIVVQEPLPRKSLRHTISLGKSVDGRRPPAPSKPAVLNVQKVPTSGSAVWRR